MKKILTCLFAIALSLPLWAVTASPYPFEVTQPDGTTIMVKLVGDEHYAYYTTVDGTPLRRLDTGFFVEDQSVADEFPTIAAQRRSAAIRPKQEATTYPLTGSPKSLVLLVGFKDLPFAQSKDDFHKLLNESGYSYNGAMGSCRDYFIAASDSLFQPQFDVYGPFTVSGNMEKYGAEDGNSHDKDPQSMVIEACQLAAKSGVNFADYDLDNNNVLDNVFVYYAGYNQAEGGPANSIWPHKWDVSFKNATVDGIKIATYACTSEFSGSGGTRRASIGTFCHEFGHVLGLPDLYDTDYSHYTVSNWDIMCSGNYNNNGRTPPTYSAYERFFLGWLKPEQLTEKGQYSLEPLQGSSHAYLIADGTHNLSGGNPSPAEFFMLEYRPKIGWDSYLPGSGMLVWHIDYLAAAWYSNTLNNGPDFLRIHMEEANGIYWNKRSHNENGKASDPYPGTGNVTTFLPKLHDGTILSDQNIFDIKDNGSRVSFIYQSMGDVQMSVDKQDLYITTTVSDANNIVDWDPQALQLWIQGLNSDTLSFSTKGNFYVAIADKAPAQNSKSWRKSFEYKVDTTSAEPLTVWVAFRPAKQNCLEVTSSLNISTLGASVSVHLTGQAPRPVYITTPEVQPATNITPYSFSFSWKPVEDAVMYYVTLFKMMDGQSVFKQDFESFANMDDVADAGWQSNVNRTTTSAKADGTKSLYLKESGEYIVSELYVVPVSQISFWVNAFASEVKEVGYIEIEAWNGEKWTALTKERKQILRTTKKEYVSLSFNEKDNYTQFRLTYVNTGGSGIAFDAFEATCTKNITFLHKGKNFSIDAPYSEEDCVYKFSGLEANANYYYGLQSTDITKGCDENVSSLSPLQQVKTVAVAEDKDEYELPIAIDITNYAVPTPVVYLSNPKDGDCLNVYDVRGALVYSCSVYEGLSEYIIPTDNLQKNCLYLVKHLEEGKMKRKQGWAKFML